MANAESIEPTDSKVYTIKLKQGWKFHDGTAVRRRTSSTPGTTPPTPRTAQQNGELLRDIAGLRPTSTPRTRTARTARRRRRRQPTGDVRPAGRRRPRPSSHARPRRSRSSRPSSATRAFMPLPDVFFTDPEAFEEEPDRQRPVQVRLLGRRTQSIKLSASTTTRATTRPKSRTSTFKLYQDADAAYDDLLAQQARLHRQVPPSALAGDTSGRPTWRPAASTRRPARRPARSRSRCTTRSTRTPTCVRPSRWRSTGRQIIDTDLLRHPQAGRRLSNPLPGREHGRLRRVLQVRPGARPRQLFDKSRLDRAAS